MDLRPRSCGLHVLALSLPRLVRQTLLFAIGTVRAVPMTHCVYHYFFADTALAA